MEIITTAAESLVTLEKPKSISVVVLGNRSVNLGVHTDTFYSLLRSLRLHDDGSLQLEGRVLTDAQRKVLEENRQYQFLLKTRVTKVTTESGLIIPAYLVPKHLDITTAEVATFLKESFSPSSLCQEIGYKTGFYNVKKMLEFWDKGQLPMLDLFPAIFGCNEFQIGFDRLTEEETRLKAQMITEEIIKVQNDSFISSSPLKANMLHGYDVIEVKGVAREEIENLMSARPRIAKLERKQF